MSYLHYTSGVGISMSILILLVVVLIGAYWMWPRPTLIYRRGAIYQRNFEELFIVEWDCKIVKWPTIYVKFVDTFFVADSSNITLTELHRRVNPSDEQLLLRLLNEDLEKFRVEAANEDRVTIKTPAGAKFDVELENTGWHFRHSQKTNHILTNRLPVALRHYRSSRSAQIDS